MPSFARVRTTDKPHIVANTTTQPPQFIPIILTIRGVTEEQRELVDKAVEALERDGGVSEPASNDLVDGSWRLIFTTTPGTASPVQRSFVGVDGFAIYQDIDIFSEVKKHVPGTRHCGRGNYNEEK